MCLQHLKTLLQLVETLKLWINGELDGSEASADGHVS